MSAFQIIAISGENRIVRRSRDEINYDERKSSVHCGSRASERTEKLDSISTSVKEFGTELRTE